MSAQVGMMIAQMLAPLGKVGGWLGGVFNDKMHGWADKIGGYDNTGANIVRGIGNLWEGGAGFLGNVYGAAFGDQASQNWLQGGMNRWSDLTFGDKTEYGQTGMEQWDYMVRGDGSSRYDDPNEPVYSAPVDTTSLFDQYAQNQSGGSTGANNTAFNSSGASGSTEINPLRKRSRFGASMSTGW